LIEHLLLGSFSIKELLVDCCCNIREISNQAHLYALMTQHPPNDTVDLSSPCCSLSWAGPFIVNAGIISLALSHVITLITIPDGLVDDTTTLDSPIHLSSIDQMVTSDKSFIYPPLHEWEKNLVWKHPEWYKIEQWMTGEMPDLPWAEYLSKV